MDNANSKPIIAPVLTGENSFNTQSKIGRALGGLAPREVHLHNADVFDAGKTRFLYGTTEPSDPSLKPGFFKLAKGSETAQLRRESVGASIARAVGIPTVDVLHPYQETEDGLGIIHLELLSAKDGIFLSNPNLLASADPKLGAMAAIALSKASGRLIPPDIDSSLLKRGDWRNQSLEKFMKVWKEQNDVVFGESHTELVNSLVGNDALHAVVNQTETELEPLVSAAQNPNGEYFVHNDAAPNNAFFKNSGEVLFLDFEHAAASHNLFLAQLTDLGNYYGRMWPNPEMQREFLISYLAESSPENLDDNYNLLKTTAVFGSMYLAKYGMQADHPEHTMSLSLLHNLIPNLTELEKKYNELKARDFTQL